MTNFLGSFNRREKTMIGATAAFILLLISYLAVIQPLTRRLHYNQERIPAQQELLTWMEQSSQKVKMSRALNRQTTQYSGSDPASSLISKTAKARGLGSGGINRMEPDGARGTRVWIEGVIFDDMLPWIALLQQNFGLTAVEIIIDKAKDPGFVNIQVLFREGRHDEP